MGNARYLDMTTKNVDITFRNVHHDTPQSWQVDAALASEVVRELARQGHTEITVTEVRS